MADYKSRMLARLNQYEIQFTNKKLEVGGADKTCKNYVDTRGTNQIVCNEAAFEHFYETDMGDVYRLVHHEFAGLAGLETSQGAVSDYVISSKISAFLESEIVERLPIHKLENSGQHWLPAIGWRDFSSSGGAPALLPLSLDAEHPVSLDAVTAAPYISNAGLIDYGVMTSLAASASQPLAEARASSSISISLSMASTKLETVIERIPALSAIDEFDYRCTLMETGEGLSIAAGNPAVAFPSQASIGLANGQLVVTAAKDAIYLSRFVRVSTNNVARLTVRILRGNEWAQVQFDAGYGLKAVTVVCEMPANLATTN